MITNCEKNNNEINRFVASTLCHHLVIHFDVNKMINGCNFNSSLSPIPCRIINPCL